VCEQSIRATSFIFCRLSPIRIVKWQSEWIVLTASVARCLWHKSAKWCHRKLLDSAKSLVTNFQLKSAKSSEIPLKNMSFLRWLKETYEVMQHRSIEFLVLHSLAMSMGWKCRSWPPHFSAQRCCFRQHTEQRNCSLPRFLYDTQFLTISSKWLHVFIQ